MRVFPEAAQQFVVTTCRTRQSKAGYLATLRQLQDQFPSLTVKDFELYHLEQFCLRGEPAAGTVRTRRSRVRSFFDWAEYRGMVDVNPASKLMRAVRVHGGTVTEHHWFDETQVGVLLAACPDTGPGRRDRVLLLLGFLLGLRRSELAGIRWTQFSPDMTRVGLVGKGNKVAHLGVPPQLRDELVAWKRECPDGCDTVLPRVMADGFSGENRLVWSQPIGSDGVYRVVRHAGLRAGINVQPHDLRRSFLGIILDHGIPIHEAAPMMRHSNIGTTDLYAKKDPRRTAALADGIRLNLG